MVIGSSKSNGELWLYAIIVANVLVTAVSAGFDYFGDAAAVAMLSLPSDVSDVIVRPWSAVTYMFVQGGVLHLLFNMLWLYCFGRIMLMVRPAAFLPAVYIGGGLAGAVSFVALYAAVPALGHATLLGSSAAVVAVAVAVAFEVPDMKLNIWPIGPVRIKWIVLFLLGLFCLSFNGGMAGSNAAHLGGAAFGALVGLHRYFPVLSKADSSSHATMQDELDRLLGKVKVSGYEALSARDKRRLFELSHKLRK